MILYRASVLGLLLIFSVFSTFLLLEKCDFVCKNSSTLFSRLYPVFHRCNSWPPRVIFSRDGELLNPKISSVNFDFEPICVGSVGVILIILCYFGASSEPFPEHFTFWLFRHRFWYIFVHFLGFKSDFRANFLRFLAHFIFELFLGDFHMIFDNSYDPETFSNKKLNVF